VPNTARISACDRSFGVFCFQAKERLVTCVAALYERKRLPLVSDDAPLDDIADGIFEDVI
jgi:hypothetical protein